MKSFDEIREETIEEIERIFHEVYSGREYTPINVDKVKYFVSKAIGDYGRRLLENKKIILTEEGD